MKLTFVDLWHSLPCNKRAYHNVVIHGDDRRFRDCMIPCLAGASIGKMGKIIDFPGKKKKHAADNSTEVDTFRGNDTA